MIQTWGSQRSDDITDCDIEQITAIAHGNRCSPLDHGSTLSVGGFRQRKKHGAHLKLWQAMCAATREAEQAVSMLAVGPCRPKAKDSLPLATLAEPAVKEKALKGTWVCCIRVL